MSYHVYTDLWYIFFVKEKKKKGIFSKKTSTKKGKDSSSEDLCDDSELLCFIKYSGVYFYMLGLTFIFYVLNMAGGLTYYFNTVFNKFEVRYSNTFYNCRCL